MKRLDQRCCVGVCACESSHEAGELVMEVREAKVGSELKNSSVYLESSLS